MTQTGIDGARSDRVQWLNRKCQIFMTKQVNIGQTEKRHPE